jgi:cytochrome c oxidase subunit II
VLSIVAAWLVWRSTRSRRPVDPARLAERERVWLVIVVVLLAALLFGTIFFVPYNDTAVAGPKQVVHVTGAQFAWAMQPSTVKRGVPVQFILVSKDVNHGFGVYDEADRLVFQVQVMPKHEHRYVHTFGDAGTYRVLCLEFCGLHHADMKTTLTVK